MGYGSVYSDLRWFISNAKNAPCTEWDNRLFLIDERFVLWSRAGNCPDASFSIILYKKTDKRIICDYSETIAGPRETIYNEEFKGLCKTVLYNVNKPDLGLGEGHTIKKIIIE